MPSFMMIALWVGTDSESARKTAIIPENPNESKGLLPSLVVGQALERTGFFAAKRHFPLFRSPALSGGAFRPLQRRSRSYRGLAQPFFMELKNSSLFLVARSLSRRNSVA